MNAKKILKITFCIFILFTGIRTTAQQFTSAQKEYAAFRQMLKSGNPKFPPGYAGACMTLLEKTKSGKDKKEMAAAYALAGMAKLRLDTNPKEASGYLYNAQLLLSETSGNYADETIEIKSALLEIYGQLSDFEKEKLFALDLVGYYLKDSVKSALDIADMYTTIGIDNGALGERISELEYLKRSKTILEKFHTENKEQYAKSQMLLERTYNSLAVSYFSLNDYENAIAYSKKCLQMSDVLAPGNPQRAINLMLIGRSIFELERDADSAMTCVNESLEIIKNADPTAGFGKTSPAWISYSHYKSDILLRAGKTDEAIAASKSVVDFVKKNNLLNANTIEMVLMHIRIIANGYIQREKLQQAFQTCQEADVLMKRFSNIRNVLATSMHAQHAKVLYKLHRNKDAEVYFDKALSPVKLSIMSLKTGKWNVDISTAGEYLETIKEAGDYFLFKGFARSGRENVRIGIDVLNKVMKASINRQNFLFEAGINEGFGAVSMELADDLLRSLFKARNLLNEEGVMTNAFSVIESAKANLLKNVLWEEERLSEILPDPVNRRRLDLKSKVMKALNKLRENNNIENQNTFVTSRENYREFMTETRKDFGFDAVKDRPVISANDQRLTQFKGTILNYFLGEEYLYIFIHSNYRKYFVCKKIPGSFQSDLNFVTNYLANPAFSDAGRTAELKRISKEWYQWLLSSTDIRDELVIIPHRQLSFISFEMLDAGEKEKDVNYVIEKHPVRYELSANLMFTGYHTNESNDLKPFGGFAASTSSLPGTAEEVKSIADIMDGDVYINTNPLTFLNNAGNYRVLHIATLAYADEGAFHECNFLPDADSAGTHILRDVQIASMKLNARLTTLSACRTGFGKLHNSEGLLSPVRSFFITGCPSVVMSLWTVNDASTSKIMTAFYTHLKKGETKSEALQHAKLDYLENETNPAKKHPYYWAGFILVGNNNPLPAPEFLKEYWGIIVTAIAVVFIVLIYFRIRANKAAA